MAEARIELRRQSGRVIAKRRERGDGRFALPGEANNPEAHREVRLPGLVGGRIDDLERDRDPIVAGEYGIARRNDFRRPDGVRMSALFEGGVWHFKNSHTVRDDYAAERELAGHGG